VCVKDRAREKERVREWERERESESESEIVPKLKGPPATAERERMGE
jgi:hypothetical protein